VSDHGGLQLQCLGLWRGRSRGQSRCNDMRGSRGEGRGQDSGKRRGGVLDRQVVVEERLDLQDGKRWFGRSRNVLVDVLLKVVFSFWRPEGKPLVVMKPSQCHESVYTKARGNRKSAETKRVSGCVRRAKRSTSICSADPLVYTSDRSVSHSLSF